MPPKRWLKKLSMWLRLVLHRREVDQELDDEIAYHVEAKTEENIAKGMSPEEARRAARLELGGVEQVKERVRSVRVGAWFETLLQDIRFGLRMLRKNPGFTAAAVLTLALGIGANTAIFSVVNAVLLRPLPYKHADRIVSAAERFPFLRGSVGVMSPDFAAWQDRNRTFAAIGAFVRGAGANLTGFGEPERVSVVRVTPGFFAVLGVKPLLGRLFLSAESKEARSHVALLSDTLWRERFRGNKNSLGKTIDLDGTAYAVVGVMPATVRYPRADLWTPLALDSAAFSARSMRFLSVTVIGRLKAGVDIAEADSDLQVITRQMDREYPPMARHFRANARADVVPLHAVLVRNVRILLMILLGGVGLVLLIACANVANLLLSRGASRGREMAVRAALGAQRWRLARQMLAESLLLAACGGVLGLLAGISATALLRQLIPPTLSASIGLDPRTFVFVAGLATVSVILFGLVPALVGSITDVHVSLYTGHAGTARGVRRLRSLLVIGEIGLSLVLLAGAGLLIRSFLGLTEVPLGFQPQNLVLATIERPLKLGITSPQNVAFFRDALRRIRALPGVQEAAATTHYPLASVPGGLRSATREFRVAGVKSNLWPIPIRITAVSTDYFRTMRIPLLKGRTFDAEDSANGGAVILSESLARQAFRSRNPIGQKIRFGARNAPRVRVIGVVADTTNTALDRRPAPEIFVPYVQEPSYLMTFVIRCGGNPEALGRAVRGAVLAVDKDQPVSELTTMDQVLARVAGPERLKMFLLGLFAFLALTLAAVGVYGVTAYSVGQRTHEIGIRMALGAQPKDILRDVLKQGGKMAAAGIALGLVASFGLTRLMSSMLFGVSATDPLTFAAVVGVLLGVSLLACWIPARRAMRVDPMVALRYE